jgi:hypothetical protein
MMNSKMVDIKAGMKPSELISDQISKLGGWRGKKLTQLRKIIQATDPEMSEEWKWGTAGWSHNGMVCSAAAFKDHIRLNFFKGAALEDPEKLFNAGLDAKDSRGIDFKEGSEISEAGLRKMIQRAVAYNLANG